MTVNKGGELHAAPGENVAVTLASMTLEPFAIFQSLSGKKLDAVAWRRQCVDLGIAGLDLGKLAVGPAEIKTPVALQADDDSRYMPKS
jgi:hypothetical protein